jgi:spermidine synthase
MGSVIQSGASEKKGLSSAAPAVFVLVTGLFFLSGSAGLVYQVLWMRSLGLFFGSDMYGVSIWGYQAMRVLLATGTLLVPTSLMGVTLPLIMKHFVRSRSVLGEMGAYFYAVNTLGALMGTLTAGFVLLPQLGMMRTTWCAVAINLAIGFICVRLGWGSVDSTESVMPDPAGLDPLPGIDPSTRRRFVLAALLAFGVSGFCSFALEVVWTRILLISFSATVYSFASTLACFLFGIFLGSRVISKVVDESQNPVGLFAILELGTAVSLGALCLLLHVVPSVFGQLLGTLAGILPGHQEYALVAATLIASFPLLVVPATLLGATFPVALRIYTTNVAHVGSRTGNIYAANTVGAVLGSLAAALILIPALGANASLALIAVLFLAVGAGLASIQDVSGRRILPLRPVGVAAAVTLLCSGGALLLPYRVTLNFNQKILADAELVYHAEGIQNTIDVVRAKSGRTSLIIGGNVEADSGYRQRRHFVLKGHLPLLFMEDPDTVLVVGLGMGITLRATARHPGLERIDVIELSPDILAAQAHLGEVNGDVVKNPLVHIRIDDGRLFMKLSTERFDMITADPIHPKISRVGYLYTKEYYQSIRERLNEGGVVCQWMPIYQLSPRRLRSAVRTFAEVFPNATLWYVEGHLLFVSKIDSLTIDYDLLVRKFEDPRVREDLASIDIGSPEELLSHLVMGPDEIRAFVNDEPNVPTNTDDYPYLEYFVPLDLFYTSLDNVRAFADHLSDPADFVPNLPPDATAELATLTEGRKQRIPSRRDGDGSH